MTIQRTLATGETLLACGCIWPGDHCTRCDEKERRRLRQDAFIQGVADATLGIDRDQERNTE